MTTSSLENWRDASSLSVPEAAAVMRVSRSTAYGIVREGQWPTITVGRRTRVLVSGLRRMLGETPELSAAS